MADDHQVDMPAHAAQVAKELAASAAKSREGEASDMRTVEFAVPEADTDVAAAMARQNRGIRRKVQVPASLFGEFLLCLKQYAQGDSDSLKGFSDPQISAFLRNMPDSSTLLAIETDLEYGYLSLIFE